MLFSPGVLEKLISVLVNLIFSLVSFNVNSLAFSPYIKSSYATQLTYIYSLFAPERVLPIQAVITQEPLAQST